MKIATQQEYIVAVNKGGRDKRIMTSKQSQTVIWSDCGTEVAEKTAVFKRGKVVSTDYMVNEKYL
ncbi:Uncharacterised protein [uncultured archaeon]|nr:Uncharacterised protein [uncultured archaeon]